MNVSVVRRVLTSFAVGSILAVLAMACGKSEATSSAGAAASKGAAPTAPAGSSADGVYEARGVITAVIPASPAGGARLSIHHERIAAFKDREGKVVGMDSMTMTFDTAPNVKVDALHVNDKIAFRAEVRWDGTPMVLVSKVEPLPAETQLTLSNEHDSRIH